MMTDASEMLAAALEQMDGIIAGSKAMQFPNGLFDCQSPTSPFVDSLRALHLLEDLRGALELMDADERESLRCQVPGTTAEGLVDWLVVFLFQTNGHNSVDTDLVYQERLTRLESDKECLVLQVSILTDQVEVQGEKIKDLDTSLEEHRQKLNATEGMLQQELLSRSALETQKLELLNEVSSLKMILSSVEKERKDNESLYQEVNDLRFRVTDMENERLQYEKKLKTTQQFCLICASFLSDMEVQRMKRALETLVAANNEKVAAAALWVESVSGPGVNMFSCSLALRRSRSRSCSSRYCSTKSTSFDLDAAESEFRRGGVRATAGPRLGWSRDLHGEVGVPFARWSKEQVCAWMQDLGLGLHVGHAQQWIQSGQTLLQASQQDLEKELGIRNHLHRKKLQLALQALGTEEDDPKSSLDFGWVTRWLDDVGLPQYKSQFDEGRVDGRMLHYMTVDDLLSLKVGSVLHHLSVKRAIQVLRLSRFEPNCLRRRPSDENNVTPAEVCQWTNHRVMEWLRSVDLAEYAPNLRGSGVHGGLMVLEPRFNVEAMALLLNIPPNKTLLRRHLATHFHLLIGPEAQRLKQECLENPDYALLTATARVKPRRLSFGGFGTLRRKRPEDGEDLLCPLDTETPQGSSFHRSLKIYEEHLEQVGHLLIQSDLQSVVTGTI
uniref:SAM domain-containing protein n=1 Tax=Denticeps clupeoides TaxID=299321 RepID=A0AAY4CSZ2_9TELE